MRGVSGQQMTKQHVEKGAVDKIISIIRNYKQEDFKFTDWYWMRIRERNINHEFLLKTFFEFEKVKLIEEDVLKRGDIGYDLSYELSGNQTLIIGVIPKDKLIFTHGILRYRRWQSALKIQSRRH